MGHSYRCHGKQPVSCVNPKTNRPVVVIINQTTPRRNRPNEGGAGGGNTINLSGSIDAPVSTYRITQRRILTQTDPLRFTGIITGGSITVTFTFTSPGASELIQAAVLFRVRSNTPDEILGQFGGILVSGDEFTITIRPGGEIAPTSVFTLVVTSSSSSPPPPGNLIVAVVPTSFVTAV